MGSRFSSPRILHNSRYLSSRRRRRSSKFRVPPSLMSSHHNSGSPANGDSEGTVMDRRGSFLRVLSTSSASKFFEWPSMKRSSSFWNLVMNFSENSFLVSPMPSAKEEFSLKFI